MLRDAELDCRKKIVEVTMTSEIILIMVRSVDVQIKSAQESRDASYGSQSAYLIAVARRFR